MDSMQIHGRTFSDTNSRYQSSDYERTSKTKAEQRDLILNYILENVDGYINYVGLPGKYWAFERKLINSRYGSNISGFESNPTIYHRFKGLMPGIHNVISKSKHITDDIKLDIHVNNSCIYVLGSIKDLTSDDMFNLLCSESGTFKFGFTDRNAIWYDFTTSLNKGSYEAIHNIKNIASDGAYVCFTLLYGRDLYFNGSSQKARIEIIEKALPGFKATDSWLYKGFNGSPMINICGKYIK